MSPTAPALPSDRQLFAAVRRGSDAAWSELLARHSRSLRKLLGTRRDRRVFDRALEGLREQMVSVPVGAEGEPAVRSFRPLVLVTVFGGGYGPRGHGVDSVDAAGDGAELLATAFARLPEPWQTVLWHRIVEGLADDEIAPLVGRPTTEVGTLVATARRGLADAFLAETDGRIRYGLDVGPLADLIDTHLAAVIVPRLSGIAAVDHRRASSRRFAGRRLSTA